MEDPKTRILVIDDDAQIRTLLSRLLGQDGYQPVEAIDAPSAMDVVTTGDPDLVLLDVMMPKTDGIELLQQIRARSGVPVIMLTALGNEADRVLGLRMGADDYVVKPFSPSELTARIESVLRRSRPSVVVEQERSSGAVDIDAATREVKVRGMPVDLTAKEFDLLAFLVASPRQVFTRDQLLHQVWASSAEWQDPATVTEHVRRLRHKVESNPDQPELLLTVRGVGYRYEPSTPARAGTPTIGGHTGHVGNGTSSDLAAPRSSSSAVKGLGMSVGAPKSAADGGVSL